MVPNYSFVLYSSILCFPCTHILRLWALCS